MRAFLVAAGLSLSLLTGGWAHAQPAAQPKPEAGGLIPARSFYRHPDLDDAQLSPSGRWLAVKGGAANGRYALVLFDVTGAEEPKLIAFFKDTDIGEFQWVNDERLVFDVDDLTLGIGEINTAPGLFSVKRDGTELRQLVKLRYESVGIRPVPGVQPLEPWHWLLYVPPGGGDEVIVGEVRVKFWPDIEDITPKRLNVVTGRTTNIAQGTPKEITGWMFDVSGAARLAVRRREGRNAVYWRDDLKNESPQAWKVLSEHATFEGPWWPAFVDAKGQLFVTRNAGKQGEAVLYRFDFATGKPEPEPLVSTPGFDFAGRPLAEYTGGQTLGLRVETDAVTTVWFDPGLKALQEEIDRRLPGRVNVLSCRRCTNDDRTVLVRSWSDRNPGEYWVLRGPLKSPTLWRLIGKQREDIDPRRMATVDFQRFAARDGRSIPVWITMPPNLPAGARPPAVVLVHGGPWVRGGHWRWDDDAQFLASRGYAVIEPEFRGSLGYGVQHFKAGWKQWGKAMQDDVADATKWAAAKGLIDPARVCIAGASYGGYATLMGLARHGDLYRCGIAWVGVSEPSLLFESSWLNDIDEESRHYGLPVLLGDLKADAALIEDASAVRHAKSIKAPVLLAYGARDQRVPLEHGRRIRSALREAGNDPQWVVYDGEGHGWRRMDSKLDFAARMEAFLARHLAPQSPPR